MCEKRFGFAVLQDIGDLRSNEVEVDRRQVPAGLLHAQIELVRLERVGQHGRDGIAWLQPQRAQPVHDLIGAGQ